MLPKTAEYALRAIVWLARDPQRSESAEHLSSATKVPRRYLHKVLQQLGAGGLVRSVSGPGGGYALAVEPTKTSILDVVNAVAPLERIERCPLGLPSHHVLCPLHAEIDKAYAATQKAFARVTIAQLLDQDAASAPLCELGRSGSQRHLGRAK